MDSSQIVHQQQQVLLRLPNDLADKVKAALKGSGSKFDVQPQDPSIPNDFMVLFEGAQYPALLVNLPTPMETQKTFDNKTFLKSGDVGQMLQVFLTPAEREEARAKVVRTAYGEVFADGLAPPTADIVHRRYELTRRAEAVLPYQIRQTVEEVLSSPFSDPAPSASAPEEVEGATVTVDEVMDFEPWMVDPANPYAGRTLTVGSDWSTPDAALLLAHPQVLVTAEDAEEDAIAALALAQAQGQAQGQQGGDHEEQHMPAPSAETEEAEEEEVQEVEEEPPAAPSSAEDQGEGGDDEGNEGSEEVLGVRSAYEAAQEEDEEEEDDMAWMKDV